MTIRHLQIFRTVCRYGSITLAADRLNITQPSVSIAIKELESFYNTKLFDRINRKIYLTQAGEALLEHTNTILEEFDQAALLLREGKAFTKCRLGVNASVAETGLSNIIKSANKNIPLLKLSVVIQNNEQIDHMLSNNTIDLAIYDSVKDTGNKKATLLYQDNMTVICSSKLYNRSNISVKELSVMPLLLREKGSGLRNCVDAEFSKLGYLKNISAESISTLALIELAENGMGFAFLPSVLAEKVCATRMLKMVTVEGATFTRNYYLVYNNKKHLTPTMKAFIEEITTNSNCL